ncbi:serine O-acetyltransferase EpsC [Vibrio sp. TH_r3]|uniref:serine O-acetyltransferase EpsC n=1 Tax=Vibrio sp. TH_r3 TaxID=3082084 RepID=UPI002954FA0B|nr:serine O-acetyltransferase EpsC [Vibrio sp. TH_r3]MDV7104895.1 serine O-acetyltransferase EpsC [Vibrio sp. TH_r3]
MIWSEINKQANQLQQSNHRLSAYLADKIFSYDNFADALVGNLADTLKQHLSRQVFVDWFSELNHHYPNIVKSATSDINHLVMSNPACPDHLTAFLSFRGLLAVQAYRFSHAIWHEGDIQSAVLLQNWISKEWDIDIHPAAKLGKNLFIDHGMCIVIGETAVIEDNVSIWHGVTLGSTLNEAGDRHPKIRQGALICAGATVLGNIEIGKGAIVAANSVVLKPVHEGVVVAGAPAKQVGKAPANLVTLTTKI